MCLSWWYIVKVKRNKVPSLYFICPAPAIKESTPYKPPASFNSSCLALGYARYSSSVSGLRTGTANLPVNSSQVVSFLARRPLSCSQPCLYLFSCYTALPALLIFPVIHPFKTRPFKHKPWCKPYWLRHKPAQSFHSNFHGCINNYFIMHMEHNLKPLFLKP